VAFLLEFQGVIRNIVALGVDPRPTPAQRFEVKERFTGLIASRITLEAGQQALLVAHQVCGRFLYVVLRVKRRTGRVVLQFGSELVSGTRRERPCMVVWGCRWVCKPPISPTPSPGHHQVTFG